MTEASAVTVEFTLPASSFPFGRATGGDPTARVQLERLIPLDGKRAPFLWVTGTDLVAFERQLRGSHIVAHAEVLARVDESRLYAIECDAGEETFLSGISEANGVVISAAGDDHWWFDVRFPDHDALSSFHQFSRDEDFPVELRRVSPSDDRLGSDVGPTPKQREALLLAVEGGYFDVPREMTLDEIGETLGISSQAASERIRRGTRAVLRRGPVDIRTTDDEAPAETEVMELPSIL